MSVIQPPDTQQLAHEGAPLVAQITAFRVVDDATFAEAVELQRGVKRFLARVAALFDPIDHAQKEARRVTIKQREEMEAPAKTAQAHIAQELADHDERRRAAHRAAEEAARMARERLEALERQRVADERARLQKVADDAQLAAALSAEARGDSQAAEKILTTPGTSPIVVSRPIMVAPPPPPPPKIEGQSFRDIWSAVCDDLDATIKAAAEGHAAARSVLTGDWVAANRMATAMKTAFSIPGWRAEKKRVSATRA